MNIKSKYVVWNEWMTKGLMKSSIICNKLYLTVLENEGYILLILVMSTIEIFIIN